MKSLKLLAAGVALAASAGGAQAVTLSLVGGIDRAFGSTANYDSVCIGSDATTCYNPTGPAAGLTEDLKVFDGLAPGPGVSIDGEAYVTVTFLGKEAGAHNTAFSMAGGSVTNHDAIGSSYTVKLGAAGVSTVLDFGFMSSIGSIAQNDGTFFAPFVGAEPSLAFSKVYDGGSSMFAFFDDSGGRRDRDFDDMVVRIDVASVPLPAGLLLMGTGLAGFGAMRRRKKSA